MSVIAIIDDDVQIGNVLENILQGEGYDTLRAYSGTEAVYLLSSTKPDLVLLDLMMPGLSGEQVLPKIQGIPVIVLSAKTDIQDKVDLLLNGAADYITKPFNTKELLARITVQLRKSQNYFAGNKLCYGDIGMDLSTMSVTVKQVFVSLTRTEFAILKILMQNPNQVLSKGVLLDRISIDTPDCTERSLKQHISNLRKKLEEVGNKDYIETVWGIGFKLIEQES